MSLFARKSETVSADVAPPGRDTPMSGLGPHLVLGTPITPPFPDGLEQIVVGMGCFWGAERPF
jgi:peptide-methionine (S)-S-oxide reductase